MFELEFEIKDGRLRILDRGWGFEIGTRDSGSEIGISDSGLAIRDQRFSC